MQQNTTKLENTTKKVDNKSWPYVTRQYNMTRH